MSAAPGTAAFPAHDARAIAQAFAPDRPWGNRGDYWYVRCKLRSDPLYAGALDALRGSRAPVLDLGCGLGLLAHALRHDGQPQPYRGLDNDAGKVARARAAAGRAGLAACTFASLDLATAAPEHRGSVAILDVLQYLPAAAQTALLERAAGMLDGDGRLVLRMTLADASHRGRFSRLGDLAGHWVGWMQARPRHYPDAASLQAHLQQAGLHSRLMPLYGATPFNNWLLVAHRA
ncbi:methyltransferase domain-containing protein [Stenotrophomonas mori]|uniref:Methyltransferase domain-containing protein n=1 Tax=Stenotrophomonas mori TaxID=2871096 RepID=A0ABT0SIZ3_9GAMM|nr:methyltransferase domain-containing protein [Stenotrophomonas mori]MCL7715086.1 methyltransferase domain-containing protein [Stenotrophomonas mori]